MHRPDEADGDGVGSSRSGRENREASLDAAPGRLHRRDRLRDVAPPAQPKPKVHDPAGLPGVPGAPFEDNDVAGPGRL